MEHETLNLEQLASILDRDVREVTKMASRGHLPGQKIGGQWRFVSAEINYWIEKQMHAYTEQELTALEKGAGRGKTDGEPLVTAFLSEQTMAVPMHARTRSSVLRELARLAEMSWNIYDVDALFEAVKQREEMASTAQSNGVAFPHPHRPMPAILGDSVIAYGRTATTVPFGGMCDIFFLICCRDHSTHLRTLARLSRMMLRPNLVEDLRAAESTAQTYRLLEAAERELLEE